METDELNMILFGNSATNRYFIGTLPSCEIPPAKVTTYCFITNTDVHDKPGQHWNGWFIRDGTLSFFDSFGRDPRDTTSFPRYYQDFVRHFDSVEYVSVPIQKLTSTACGLFCVHFIYLFSFGLDFRYFLSEYYRNVNLNDDVVISFIDSVI